MKDDYCTMQPGNMGLCCKNVSERKCTKCGWNPDVAEQRRLEQRVKLMLEREGQKDD